VPDDKQGSIALGRAAAETGTKTLVTTPRIDRRAPGHGTAQPRGPRSGADRDPRVSADPGAPGRGAQPQSLIAAITIPITTKTTTAICIQIQVGDMP
jgi:hypothetical protein